MQKQEIDYNGCISFVTLNRRNIHFVYNDTTTLDDIIKKFHDIYVCNNADLIRFYSEDLHRHIVIDDLDKTPSQLGLKDFTKLTMSGKLFNTIYQNHEDSNDVENNDTIFIKLLNGRTMAIPINSKETVKTLKNKICKENNSRQSTGINITPTNQCLIFAGRQLNDNDILYNIGARNEATIYLITKQDDFDEKILDNNVYKKIASKVFFVGIDNSDELSRLFEELLI